MPGEPELHELVRATAPRIDALARRWCGADAADGTQEVHRQLTSSWPGYRGDAAPTTWAHRIAVRTLARSAERARCRLRREPSASDPGSTVTGSASSSGPHADRAPSRPGP